MAIIPELPATRIIDGFRGALDFYVHKGQNVVRMWPRKPAWPRAPLVQVGIDNFRYINQLSSTLGAEVREAYDNMARGTSLTWRDYLVRSYIRGIDY